MQLARAAIASALPKDALRHAKSPAHAGARPVPTWPRHLADIVAAAVDGADPASAMAARRLGDLDSTTSCDADFMRCVLSETCRSCFTTLQENEVDWTNVLPDTPCQDVLGFLSAGGHCKDVRAGGLEEEDVFCTAFDACIVWDDDEDEAAALAREGDAEGAGGGLDCAALEECAFPGLHEHFLGDGVCHDALPGCYNSKACNYDGGDCCEDTCHYPGQDANGDGDAYGECGAEGYACADPSSAHCAPALARPYGDFCEEKEGDRLAGPEEERLDVPSCKSSDEQPYRLVQYDSWGDGWDNTVLTLTRHGSDPSDEPIYRGGLEYGAQGTVHVCLTKKEPKCYHVKVENAVWGNEISWELRPLSAGAPVIAAGGSPSDCAVSLGGEVDGCPNNCEATRPDTKINDPNYSSYKSMESCIESKCVIQVGNCVQDESCVECMQESTPDYCYANDNFSVLVDCTMCSCQEERPEYCDAMKSGAAESSISGSSEATHQGKTEQATALVPKDGSATGGTAACGPDQTLKGTTALIQFSSCGDFEEMDTMLTHFDNDNFGKLDTFEECAHTYQDKPMHGGKDAMDCMKILHNTAEGSPLNKRAENDGVANAISSLANHLYHDGEAFCECTAKTNQQTPTCSSFVNFKTLLFEAVDACRSLDAIDCAAWEEFYTPCKSNLLQNYDVVDFDNKEQCHFVEDTCGGAGPFPAFRRLDCGGEIAKPAWDFHTMYSRGCVGVEAPSSSSASASNPVPASPKSGSGGSAPPPRPAPKSIVPPSTAEKKQYKPYNANGASDEKKPYFSKPTYESSDPAPDTPKSKSKKHHFFRNAFLVMALALVGFVFYRKRRENFDYARFRQMREARNHARGANSSGLGEYTGVSVSDSCTFEPPTLPPTPL